MPTEPFATTPAAQELQTIAQELRDFRPFPVGDPIGNLADTHTVSLTAATLATFAVAAAALLLVWLHARRRGWSRRRLLRRTPLAVLPSALLTLLALVSAHYYYGGPFNYAGYAVPERPADVLIWFAGADDGAYACVYAESNYWRALEQFGPARAALFSFADLPQALDYARRLPQGSRLVVRGHSMGGATAIRFARQSPHDILLLDTRDATSWFGHAHERPPRVRHWRNVLPADTALLAPRDAHPNTNYWGSLNMANVFRLLGRPWGRLDGAANLLIPGADHHEVGNNLREDCLPSP